MKNQLYQTSSQNRAWMIQNIDQHNEMKIRQYQNHIKSKFPNINFTLNDENEVLNQYIDYLQQIFQISKLRKSIEAYSIIYFKRFYLKKTFINQKPKQIAFICIYLACKVQEFKDENIQLLSKNFQQDKNLCHFIHYGHEKYPQLENLVLKILDFDLVVYHIYTPLQALITNEFQQYENEINNLAHKTFYNQFIFIYTHNQLAFNIIIIIAKKHNLKIPFYDQLKHLENQQLLNLIEQIQSYIVNKNEGRKIFQMITDVNKLKKEECPFQKPTENPNIIRNIKKSNN